MLHPSHYDPNEPRVPKGHDGGGQWTRDAYDSFQLAFAGPLPAVPGLLSGLTAGLGLFGLLSSRNRPGAQAVIAFKAREYLPTDEKVLNLEAVAQLDRDQVQEACERFKDVQSKTDFAAATANGKGISRATEYGTAVHFWVSQWVKEQKKDDFKSEVSYIKMKEELVYGTPGSIRVDILENREAIRTVCVYDIKTGRSGLSLARLHEIATHVYANFPKTLRIIIIEVRPGIPRRLHGPSE